MNKQRILELIELEQKATPAPWKAERRGISANRVYLMEMMGTALEFEHDLSLLVALRNEAPALLRDHLRLLEIEEAAEKASEELQGILNWARAYPLGVFPEPEKDEWARVHELLKANGMAGIDRFSASIMRHLINGVKGYAERADAALNQKGEQE